MAILNQLTLGQKKIILTDSDPSVIPGIQAPIGSLAIYNVGSAGRTYIKTGSGNTAWSRMFASDQVIPVANGGTGQTTQVAPLYMTGAKPIFINATSFSIAEFYCKDSTNSVMINNSAPVTLSTGTLGAINGIAQSANLTGTVTVTAGSATITGSGTAFLSELQVGDVISVAGSQSLRIIARPTNTSATAERAFTTPVTGATFRRGGLAPNTYYYLYAISDGSSNGYILTTRNYNGAQSVEDLPAGYTYFRQMAFFLQTDATGALIGFKVCEGWPYTPLIRRYTPVVIFSGNIPSAWIQLQANVCVPPISTAILTYNLIQTSSAMFFTLNPSIGVLDVLSFGYASPGSPGGALPFQFVTNPDQSFYIFINSNAICQTVIMGCFVTEVYK